MGLPRRLAGTAFLFSLLYSDVSGQMTHERSQMTYERSLEAKRGSRCAGEFQIKTGGAYKISDIHNKAMGAILGTELDRSMSDQQKTEKLMAVREIVRRELGREYAQYTDCVANYVLVSPVGSSLYKKTGRVQPPLTGTYEEQVRTLVREFRWEVNYYASLKAAAERRKMANARHVVRLVWEIKNMISALPDPITAEISITGEGVEGRIRPRFLGYDRNEMVTFRRVKGPPRGSRLETRIGTTFHEYEMYSVGASPTGFVLLRKDVPPSFPTQSEDPTSYSSFNRGDLLKYMKFLEDGSTSVQRIDKSSSSWHFLEFSKFFDRLGNNFDGDAMFRAGRVRVPRGYNYVIFEYYGLKGHNTAEHKDLGIAAYFSSDPTWSVINPGHIKFMRENFAEFFTVNGPRQEIHMRSQFRSHSGTHPPGVIDLPANVPGTMFIIKEEK